MRLNLGNWQSSRLKIYLPAWLVPVLASVVMAAPSLDAQQAYRVRRSENFRQRPDPTSPILAIVTPNLVLRGSRVDGGWIEVTLEGWIWARSIARVNDSIFDLNVSASGGENFRDAPNGELIARLSEGTLLNQIERRGNWARVQRTAWMWGQSLEPIAGAGIVRGGGRPPRVGTQTANAGDPPSLDIAVTTDTTYLRIVPDAENRGIISPETPVRILERSGIWAHIQLEGWVKLDELRPAEGGPIGGVSGAEVRARPQDYTGSVLQWKVQFISVQVANELRRDLPTGQHFMLVRGPIPESGFIYVLLPADRVAEAEALQPLEEIWIIGRVRSARSQSLGNPILELLDLAPSND